MFPFSGRYLELSLIIIVFIAVIIGFMINDYYYKEKPKATEPFENYYLSSCPQGYKLFYDTNGNSNCCKGEILANKCNADRQCTLNGKGTKEMPNCVDLILEDYKEKAKTQCPSSMNSYFEDLGANTKGCTNGRLNDTLTGPRDISQPKCKIYDSMDKNINTKDSCYNIRLLDAAKCFGNNCTKQILQPMPNKPVLIGIGFTDSLGMYKLSVTRESAITYLNAVLPNWRESGIIDLSKNIQIAEVAKAYYIDRTMDKSQVDF